MNEGMPLRHKRIREARFYLGYRESGWARHEPLEAVYRGFAFKSSKEVEFYVDGKGFTFAYASLSDLLNEWDVMDPNTILKEIL